MLLFIDKQFHIQIIDMIDEFLKKQQEITITIINDTKHKLKIE